MVNVKWLGGWRRLIFMVLDLPLSAVHTYAGSKRSGGKKTEK